MRPHSVNHRSSASMLSPLRCAVQAGALRLSMVPYPRESFIEAVKQTVAANADFVPPQGKGSLYLRPLLFGSGPILGLGEPEALSAAAAGCCGGLCRRQWPLIREAPQLDGCKGISPSCSPCPC